MLSGPSGVGKDAAIAELKKLDRPWYFAITATTRPMRPGERDGVDYIFLGVDTFQKMRERDEFLEERPDVLLQFWFRDHEKKAVYFPFARSIQ